jgi:RNA polymerase sigma-70 factor (ECF subfamily)
MAVAPRCPIDLSPQTILHEYAPRVYAIARRMLGNVQDAEDVAQDVLLQMLRKADTFRGEANVSTWLHRITVNAALEFRRKRAVRHRHQVPAEVDALADEVHRPGPRRRWSLPPDQDMLDRETQQLIEDAIAGLPETYRDVYVLADVEGLPNAEIAAILDLGVPAVKSRLHRARMMMRHTLSPHFEESQG